MSSEVKGAWFIAARAWLTERENPFALERIVHAMPQEHRDALRDPIPSSWYPEEALQTALRALRDVLDLDAARFVDVMDACTVIGTSRFFRALLRVATPSFVLRQVPVMWGRIRRGAGRVEVDDTGTEALLRYREFPYFADEHYRLLTVGSLRAVVRTCTGRDPDVTVVRWTPDALDVRVRYG